MSTLFTIGHSNHDATHFLSLLSAHGVSAVADVRSSPYSKYVPQFSKDNLQRSLRDANIDYLFLGRELGARRDENSCFVNGRATYALIAQLPAFQSGIDRVLRELEDRPVALMCAEAGPLDCHRTILVCREMGKVAPTLSIEHILRDTGIEPHAATEARLVERHQLEPELFGALATHDGRIARAYDLEAERIAYRRGVVRAGA